ncbi:hypothetical protein BDP27DRAFT_1314367, partial [Rhodocollybia butyracea]
VRTAEYNYPNFAPVRLIQPSESDSDSALVRTENGYSSQPQSKGAYQTRSGMDDVPEELGFSDPPPSYAN